MAFGAWRLKLRAAEDGDVIKAKTPRGRLLPLFGVVAAAVALALLTQRVLAEQVGRFLAEVWVSAMTALLSILGAFLGG